MANHTDIVTYSTMQTKRKKSSQTSKHKIEHRIVSWRDLQRQALSEYRGSRVTFGQGTENADQEVLWALCSIGGFTIKQFFKLRNQKPSPVKTTKILKIIRKRIKTDQPLAYLLQEAWFGGKRFYVDNRALIPRSPFAEVITKRLNTLIAKPPSAILEIATGSGCIAILASLQYPRARIIASDISSSALQVAKKNVKNFSLQKQISLLRADCYGDIDQTFDLILANPPYVKNKDYQRLPKPFFYEPKQALVSPIDDLRVVHRIIKNAPRYLTPEGVLIIEVGQREHEVKKQCKHIGFKSVPLEYGGSGLLFATRTMLA